MKPGPVVIFGWREVTHDGYDAHAQSHGPLFGSLLIPWISEIAKTHLAFSEQRQAFQRSSRSSFPMRDSAHSPSTQNTTADEHVGKVHLQIGLRRYFK
jgi:hypothetical protein